MRRYGLILAIMLLLLIVALPSQGANIHMHYFESADAFLTDTQFQLFSFSGIQDEKITIVAYGLEPDVIPTISLFDLEGITVAEDLNGRLSQVAVVEMVAPANGIYTFVVSRATATGGLVRVMLFTGEPLFDDLSLLDKIDPFVPSVAYLMAGDENDPVEIRLSVVETNKAPDSSPIEIYASRGTDIDVPPLIERITPVTEVEWVNDSSQVFYTINVRNLPDPVTTSFKTNAQFARMKQVLDDVIQLRLDIEEGSDTPIIVPRPMCTAAAQPNATLLLGPSPTYRDSNTTIDLQRPVEIVGENGDYYLIIDPDNPLGGSWILKSQLVLDFPLGSEACSRVQFVDAPPLTPETQRQAPPAPPGSS